MAEYTIKDGVRLYHCQSTRDLPRDTVPVVAGAGITWDSLIERLSRQYPGVQLEAYELGGLVSFRNPEYPE